jgi:transglutaminase-like putative cysteine protease
VSGTSTEAPARADAVNLGVQRTLLALLASGLGAVPLCQLLSDRGWLLDVWLSMVVALAPALILRLWRPPGALQIWPGIALLVPWLTVRFVPHHALLGIIPTPRTWDDVNALLDDLHRTTHDGVAPVHSTVAVRLALSAMLGLLAALVDLIAVVGRHGALAGVPLLVVFTVSGAIPRHNVHWPLFVFAAAGFLLLLALDARDDLASWGHRVTRAQPLRARAPAAVAGQRIAVLAVLIAVLLPMLAPINASNLVSDLLRGKNKHADTGFGAGGGGSIDPFVALRGQLTRTSTQDLATVTIDGPPGVRPFYLRENVLTRFTGDGWAPADHGPREPINGTDFGTLPGSGIVAHEAYTARIEVSGLSGNPSVFGNPTRIDGLSGGSWTPQDQLLVGTSVRRGQTYRETVRQPNPSIEDLQNAPAGSTRQLAEWLTLPQIPEEVRSLVSGLIGGRTGPYAKARAISDYFADPANGFTYSLQTAAGDSGNDLVDFLRNKIGYCQQFSAAMAVMLRLAQVPARVVLGYTHQAPDADGTFTVTTNDAHAWVEAYFAGIGWVPFDPTPLSGADGGRATSLPWAPHDGSQSTSTATATTRPSTTAPTRHTATAAPTAAAVAGSSTGGRDWTGWAVPLGVLLILLGAALTPWLSRARLRRRRLRAGRAGDPDPLWAELSDTAVDLGYVWSDARSPRQVARWLGEPAGDARPALLQLARAVEQHRYRSADGRPGPDLVNELRTVTHRLRAGRTRGARLRSQLWPASLHWSPARWSSLRRGLRGNARHR